MLIHCLYRIGSLKLLQSTKVFWSTPPTQTTVTIWIFYSQDRLQAWANWVESWETKFNLFRSNQFTLCYHFQVIYTKQHVYSCLVIVQLNPPIMIFSLTEQNTIFYLIFSNFIIIFLNKLLMHIQNIIPKYLLRVQPYVD